MKLTDYLDELAEKAGKKLEEIGEKIERKLEEVDERLGQGLEEKVEGVTQIWKNLDHDAKKDIKKGTAVATGTGIIFGGIPALIGLIYATKKFKDAYDREQNLSKTKSLYKEEKQKLENLGLEAYVNNITKNKEVYGNIPKGELDELQKLAAETEAAGLRKGHHLRRDAERNLYSLGVSYRNRTTKKEQSS